MENMIEIAIDERAMAAHAIATAIEATPAFLPPVTIARADGRGALLYSSEGMTPIALYGTGPTGGFALCDVFELLYGYIRCMLAARDRLMDTRLLSSDPLRGVFAARASIFFVVSRRGKGGVGRRRAIR